MKNIIQKMKQNKGITLIALIITIIILLILAGLVIAQLSEKGLFEKAIYAKKTYENAQENEEKQTAEMEEIIESISSSRNNKTGLENFLESEELINWISKLDSKNNFRGCYK